MPWAELYAQTMSTAGGPFRRIVRGAQVRYGRPSEIQPGEATCTKKSHCQLLWVGDSAVLTTHDREVTHWEGDACLVLVLSVRNQFTGNTNQSTVKRFDSLIPTVAWD